MNNQNQQASIEKLMSEICVAQSLLEGEIKRNPVMMSIYPKHHNPFSFRYSTRHFNFILGVLGVRFKSDTILDLFYQAENFLLEVGKELGYHQENLEGLINEIQVRKFTFEAEEPQAEIKDDWESVSENRIYERLKKAMVEMISEFKKK